MEAPHPKPARRDEALLERLLSDRNQHPERAAEIDRQIQGAFEHKVAILVLDMCGFSRLTAEYGIIHFLAMIHQMKQGAGAAVIGNGGHVVKTDADNLFAIFKQPAQAVEAALDIFRAFEAMNAVVPEERHLRGSIGIGYGATLVIDGADLFGCEMNFASKLGEDLADAMEILLTPAAYEALPAGHFECEAKTFTISGIEIPCQRFARALRPSLK